MDCVRIEDVEKIFNDLQEWEKQKFIQKFQDEYGKDPNSVEEILEYFNYNMFEKDLVRNIFDFFGTEKIMRYLGVYDMLEFIKDTAIGVDEKLLDAVDEKSAILERTLEEFEIKDILKRLEEEDRDAVLNYVLYDNSQK